jgi:hypothetical protein
MKKLKLILEKANEILGENVFEFRTGATEPTICNVKNRFEGNDIDMTEENGFFELRMTGLTESYSSIDDAVNGLVFLMLN